MIFKVNCQLPGENSKIFSNMLQFFPTFLEILIFSDFPQKPRNSTLGHPKNALSLNSFRKKSTPDSKLPVTKSCLTNFLTLCGASLI